MEKKQEELPPTVITNKGIAYWNKQIEDLYQIIKANKVLTNDDHVLIQKYMDEIMPSSEVDKDIKYKISYDVKLMAVVKHPITNQIKNLTINKSTIPIENEKIKDFVNNKIDFTKFETPQGEELTEKEIEENFNDNQSIISEESDGINIDQYISLTDSELKLKLKELFPIDKNKDKKTREAISRKKYNLTRRIKKRRDAMEKGITVNEKIEKTKNEIAEQKIEKVEKNTEKKPIPKDEDEMTFDGLVDSIMKLQAKYTGEKYTREELSTMSQPFLMKVFKNTERALEEENFNCSKYGAEGLVIFSKGLEKIATIQTVRNLIKVDLEGFGNNMQKRQGEIMQVFDDLIKEHPWVKKYLSPVMKLALIVYSSAQETVITNATNKITNINIPQIIEKKNPQNVAPTGS